MVAACPFPARRGTPLRVERLAEALVERGHTLELATYDLAEEIYPHVHGVHRPSGAACLGTLPPGPSAAKFLRYNPALLRMLAKLLRRRSFDIIHAHHYEGAMIGAWAARALGVPLVYDAHTLLSSELPTYQIGLPNSLKRKLGAWFDRRVPALADHTVAVTPDIRERLVSEFGRPSASVSVAMNGVEAERFANLPLDAATPDRIVYCGTAAAYQGIDLLLRAFSIALQRRPSLELVLAVSAPFEPYAGLAAQLGVRDAIRVEEDSFERLPERLAAASIAVLPRVACDGIPQKLLNYMAAGKAVVAFRGSAKVLEHGRTGIVIENGDVEGFGAALVRLSEDLALTRSLGAAARSYVLGQCSWEETAARCERVYHALLPPPAPRASIAGASRSRAASQ